MNFLAGGVNSPIPIPPAFPRSVIRGSGAYVIGEDGREYIDLWMGYGALLFGHRDPEIEAVIHEAIADGWFFSLPRREEILLASALHYSVPCAECVRFATTGSDAIMYAVRSACAYTKRKQLLCAYGGYHGATEG